MKDFLIYTKKYKKHFILAVLCIVIETVFELIIPMIMADIIDVGIVNRNKDYIILKGAQMVLLAIVSLILGMHVLSIRRAVEVNCCRNKSWRL